MSFRSLNLARRPFANTRPVVRVSILLWTAGIVLACINLWLYGRSLSGMEHLNERLATTEERILQEETRIAEAEEALRGMDLRTQNAEALYLNARIAERSFPWSRLFDHLAEVLPREVRLQSLSPRRFDPEPRESEVDPARAAARPDRASLSLRGNARDDEALLAFLDQLFASSRFRDPELSSETRQDDNSLRFQLSVTYLPEGPGPGRPVEPGPLAGVEGGGEGLPTASSAARGEEDVASAPARDRASDSQRPSPARGERLAAEESSPRSARSPEAEGRTATAPRSSAETAGESAPSRRRQEIRSETGVTRRPPESTGDVVPTPPRPSASRPGGRR